MKFIIELKFFNSKKKLKRNICIKNKKYYNQTYITYIHFITYKIKILQLTFTIKLL